MFGTQAESAGLRPRRRLAVLGVAIGAIALDTALLGLIAPLLPTIERRIGASEAELGIALAAYAVPILFVSLPFGRLADAIGRRPLLLTGLLLTAAGSVLIAFAHELAPLLVGRAIQGVGSAASWIAALALVSDLAPAGRKGESIGYALAANSVGAIGGPALGGLTGEAIGFEFPFLTVAVVGLGLAAAGVFVLPRGVPSAAREEGTGAESAGPGERRRAASSTLLRLTVSRLVLPATVITVFGAAMLGLIDVVVPLDADERLGLGAAAIGGLFAATVLLDALAAPLAGRAGDRVGRTPVALVGLLGVAASTVLFSALGGTAGLVCALAVFGVGGSILFAATVPWLDASFGDFDRGFGYGFLNVIYSLGYTTGPLVAGFALQASGPALAYGTATAAALAATALLLSRWGELRAVVVSSAAAQELPSPPPR